MNLNSIIGTDPHRLMELDQGRGVLCQAERATAGEVCLVPQKTAGDRSHLEVTSHRF